ncbi:hypothetical protein ACRCD5_01145 [Campylobacter taeniopygiae]
MKANYYNALCTQMYEILYAKVSKNFDKIAKDDTSKMFYVNVSIKERR